MSHRYLWGPAVEELLADEQIGQIIKRMARRCGPLPTTSAVSATSSMTPAHKSYDAFGNVTAEANGAVDSAFAYTGRQPKLLNDTKLPDSFVAVGMPLCRWGYSQQGHVERKDRERNKLA